MRFLGLETLVDVLCAFPLSSGVPFEVRIIKAVCRQDQRDLPEAVIGSPQVPKGKSSRQPRLLRVVADSRFPASGNDHHHSLTSDDHGGFSPPLQRRKI